MVVTEQDRAAGADQQDGAERADRRGWQRRAHPLYRVDHPGESCWGGVLLVIAVVGVTAVVFYW